MKCVNGYGKLCKDLNCENHMIPDALMFTPLCRALIKNPCSDKYFL